MRIFNKLQNFIAKCRFCQEVGHVLGAYVDESKEIAVCETCANKLVMGISVALAELEKQEAVRQEKASSQPVEGVIEMK